MAHPPAAVVGVANSIVRACSHTRTTCTYYVIAPSSATYRDFSAQPKHKDTKSASTRPWWSLSSLHKRVATVLATSLPDSFRSDLHHHLTQSLSEKDSHKSHSINEAIVSARAREASTQYDRSGNKSNNMQAEWLAKQKQLEAEIEERALEKAKERMQLELLAMQEQFKRKEEEQQKNMEIERQRKVAFEQWQNTVAKEREQEEHKSELEITSNQDALDEASVDATTLKQPHHPILGPQLAHLSYKRIHLTPAATLASLPVYEKQRSYRHDRAQVMAKDKKKTLWMGVPGIISLMEDEDGRLSILDGQHRVGMLSLLLEDQRNMSTTAQNGDNNEGELANLDLNNILVEVFPQRPKDESVLANQKQMELDDRAAIFTEINKAEPIKLLDLPGIANKRTRDIIDHAASHFYDAFPAMFSASQKCRSPHLNLDNLRDALFASEVLQREKIGSGGELVKWITKKNMELKERYADIESKGSRENEVKVSETALNKAKKHDFYLGLESTWLYK
ncbi:predicted protein [Thalassiosira pseudonana CCMP1335]|uniref:Uncharacterized protein n=1 Tax=Thalassiosira pseudonana TaxID=35128 RepID=B8C3L9_THAPS|nr:predicted protein [Thalassiosira pseudonana CCMP1335]EED92143.1 predicted protein [Thalassiosira pseudonana CCMP1335]